MEIKEILEKLIQHKININEAEVNLKDMINGFRRKGAVELKVESVSFGAETNTGHLHLIIPYEYWKISYLNKGDKVDISRVY
jgi:hypothetical protein